VPDPPANVAGSTEELIIRTKKEGTQRGKREKGETGS
jgi:hypothetical protein